MRYSLSTGIGIVSNYSKKTFELRKENWYDTRHLPASGMLIEFSCNHNHYIINAKASAYQAFPPDSLVKESDFWKTNTDEELQQKEQEIKDALVQKIFKETNYFSIQHIPLSISIEKSIKKYFFQELSAIELATENTPKPDTMLLDYFESKRFLDKAIDYLVFTDKNITVDLFAEHIQIINRLNYSYHYFTKNTNLNPHKIFLDYFLDTQIYYCAAIRAQDGLKERIIELETRIKNDITEIKSIYLKMERKKDLKNLENRLKVLKNRVNKTDEELKILTPCLKNINGVLENFKKLHKEEFEKKFKAYHLSIVQKTLQALNLHATKLDDSIWSLAMQSIPIHNTFFKQNITGSYCSMTFMWLYLQKLDKSKLSPNDKKAYESYLRCKQKYEKIFLILTSNHRLEIALKIKILSESKYNSVCVAKTNADFFSQVHQTKFENIYMDSGFTTPIPNLIAEIKNTKINPQANITLITEEEIYKL